MSFEGRQCGALFVLSLVDDTHPAAAQLLDDAVVRDGLADHMEGSQLERT